MLGTSGLGNSSAPQPAWLAQTWAEGHVVGTEAIQAIALEVDVALTVLMLARRAYTAKTVR
jgi:hypothetical protein